MTMSSRPLSSAITPFQQAAIARALPRRGAAGVLHNTMVSAEGRQFSVTAARPVGEGDWEATFSAVVARRTSARVDRLLPVVATGCHDGYHWVAYESGIARPLVADGWRRWPAPLALDLVSDVGNSLDDAAAFGVVPYELLPSSIFMDSRLGPLLGDLGAAREAVGSPPAADDPGRVFTPPEVIDGGVAGARSGVFVCGALLYTLLAGGHPRHDPVTRWRADLPEEINLVLARAMARDTLERYRSAGEFCDSARRALDMRPAAEPEPLSPRDPRGAREPLRAVSEPIDAEPEPIDRATEPIHAEPEPISAEPEPFDAEPQPIDAIEPAFEPVEPPFEPAEPSTEALEPVAEPAWRQPRPEPPLEPFFEQAVEDYEWRPPVPPAVRWLAIGFAVVAVVLGAVVGFQAGQPDPPASASGPEVAGGGLRLTLPAGWNLGEARGNELLAAYPNTDWFAGLTIRSGAKGSAPSTRSDPVRLGNLDVWRDTSDAPRFVRYVLPTSEGPLQISCEATSPGSRTTLAMCERSISTLSLDNARPLPLGGVVRKPGLRAEVEKLRRARVAGRAALARAHTPKAQRAAALQLQRATARAADRLGRLPDTDALAASAAGAAKAYGALAKTAGTGKRQAWQRALDEVRRAEAKLAQELKQQG
jgi:hypothetical protein